MKKRAMDKFFEYWNEFKSDSAQSGWNMFRSHRINILFKINVIASGVI